MKILATLFTILLLVNFCFSTPIRLLDGNNCSFNATDGNIYDLSSIGYLEYNYPATSAVPNRIIALNLCTALTGTQPCGTNPKPTYICQKDSATSQTGMGLTANTPSQLQPSANDTMVSLQYTGVLCGMNNIKTIVNIECGSDDKITSVTQGTLKSNSCSVQNTIIIQSNLFCPSSPKSGLSGGDIFLIIFFCGFGAYFIFGIAIQCYRGKRGAEAVPNVEFWKSFGALIKDGVGFIKSKIFRSAATSGYQAI
ncbi:hypothetical protein ACTFIY_005592 [Dictyostelium cf. discoideum]